MTDAIKSRGWNIEPEMGDIEEQIGTKNRIRKVLELNSTKTSNKRIADETRFSESDVVKILLREVTFTLG